MRFNFVKILFSLSLLLSSSLWAARTPEEIRADLDSIKVDAVIFRLWIENDVTFEDVEAVVKGAKSPSRKTKGRLGNYKKFLASKAKDSIRAAQPQRKNPHFFGHPSKAKNASPDEQRRYEDIFATLARALARGQITQATYDQAIPLLEALHIWHSNLEVITKESNDRATGVGEPNSPSYQSLFRAAFPRYLGGGFSAPSLHAENNPLGIEFQDKPAFLLGTTAHLSPEDAENHASFLQAFQFALDHNLLEEFLRAFVGVSGCLEAHFGAASDWLLKERGRRSGGGRAPVRGRERIMGILAHEAASSALAGASGAGAAAAEAEAAAKLGEINDLLREEGGFYTQADDNSHDGSRVGDEDPDAFAEEVLRLAKDFSGLENPGVRNILYAAATLRQTRGYGGTPGPTPQGTPERRPAARRTPVSSPGGGSVPSFLPQAALDDIAHLTSDQRQELAAFLVGGTGASASASASPLKKDEKAVSIPDFAVQHGLYNPVGDGLCFFHAVAFAMVGMDDAVAVAELQANGIAFMLEHPEHFAGFEIGNPAQQLVALNAYIEAHLGGAWAEDPVIQAVVNAHNLYLTVHNYGPQGQWLSTYNIGNLAGQHLTIVNFANVHFLAQDPHQVWVPLGPLAAPAPAPAPAPAAQAPVARRALSLLPMPRPLVSAAPLAGAAVSEAAAVAPAPALAEAAPLAAPAAEEDDGDDLTEPNLSPILPIAGDFPPPPVGGANAGVAAAQLAAALFALSGGVVSAHLNVRRDLFK